MGRKDENRAPGLTCRYGLNCFPESHVEVLTPDTSERNLIEKEVLCHLSPASGPCQLRAFALRCPRKHPGPHLAHYAAWHDVGCVVFCGEDLRCHPVLRRKTWPGLQARGGPPPHRLPEFIVGPRELLIVRISTPAYRKGGLSCFLKGVLDSTKKAEEPRTLSI